MLFSISMKRVPFHCRYHPCAVWAVTNPKLTLVRMHGRNRETWNQKGLTSSAERFNYDYSDEELSEVAKKIRAELAQALTTHVVMNNNFEDQGQRNARTLTALLGADPTDGRSREHGPSS